MKTENSSHAGCLQRDSVEREGYAGALSAIAQEAEETEGALLARILDRDNLNRAYKRVKVNKGAPGIDGRSIEETFVWLKEHGKELVEQICRDCGITDRRFLEKMKRIYVEKPGAPMKKAG